MKARMQPNIAGRLSSLMMKPALQTPTTAKQVPPPLLVAELFDKAGNSVATLTRDARLLRTFTPGNGSLIDAIAAREV